MRLRRGAPSPPAAYERAATPPDTGEEEEDVPESPYGSIDDDDDEGPTMDLRDQLQELNRAQQLRQRVWRPSGYSVFQLTPAEVEQAYDDGSVLKVDVGPVGRTRRRAFSISPILDGPSKIVTITAERPLGVVFAEDTKGRVRVEELVEDGEAARAAAVAKLNGRSDSFLAVGDVLRASTASVVSVPRGAGAQLLGNLDGSARVIILYGADSQPAEKTLQALRQGKVADGPCTLVVERPSDESRDAEWSAFEEKEAPPLPASAAQGLPSTPVRGVPPAANGVFAITAASLLILLLQGF